jgi:hypothetical protein
VFARVHERLELRAGSSRLAAGHARSTSVQRPGRRTLAVRAALLGKRFARAVSVGVSNDYNGSGGVAQALRYEA